MRNIVILACIIAVVGYFGSKFYLHDKVSRNLDAMLAAAQPMADVQYEGVSSTLSGELGIDGVTVRIAGFSDPLYIDSIRIITPGYFHLLDLARLGSGSGGDFDFPENLAIAFKGLTMPADADYLKVIADARRAEFGAEVAANPAADCVGKYGFSGEMLQQLGYSQLVVDASVGYRQEDQRLVLDVSTNVAEMYDFAMALTFDGMPTPQTIMMGAFQPRLVKGRMEYVDRSLAERVMRVCTEERNLTEDAVIAARVDAFRTVASSSGIVFDQYVMDPYVEFLQGKDRFIITAQPIKPVDLTQIGLYKPSDVPALLNLSAEAL